MERYLLYICADIYIYKYIYIFINPIEPFLSITN